MAARSLIGRSAYRVRYQRTTVALVSTDAVVNPIIGLVLGVALGGEGVSVPEWTAADVVSGGVVPLLLGRRQVALQRRLADGAGGGPRPPPAGTAVAPGYLRVRRLRPVQASAIPTRASEAGSGTFRPPPWKVRPPTASISLSPSRTIAPGPPQVTDA